MPEDNAFFHVISERFLTLHAALSLSHSCEHSISIHRKPCSPSQRNVKRGQIHFFSFRRFKQGFKQRAQCASISFSSSCLKLVFFILFFQLVCDALKSWLINLLILLKKAVRLLSPAFLISTMLRYSNRCVSWKIITLKEIQRL